MSFSTSKALSLNRASIIGFPTESKSSCLYSQLSSSIQSLSFFLILYWSLPRSIASVPLPAPSLPFFYPFSLSFLVPLLSFDFFSAFLRLLRLFTLSLFFLCTSVAFPYSSSLCLVYLSTPTSLFLYVPHLFSPFFLSSSLHCLYFFFFFFSTLLS